MVTLASIQGSSLVPQFAAEVREDLGAAFTRKRETKAKAELEKNLAGVFGGQPAEGTAATNDALGILGQLNPEMAQAAEAVRKSNDPQQIAAFRAEIDKGARDAKAMLGLNTHGERKKLIEKKFAEAAARGEDTSNLVRLSNMQEGELQLALTKMSVVADSARRVLPSAQGGGPLRFFSTPARTRAFAKVAASDPATAQTLLSARSAEVGRDVQVSEGALGREATARERALSRADVEQFEPVFDSSGNIVGQRSSKSGRVVADPRAGDRAETFEDVFDDQGNIVAQRNKETGELSEAPEALAGVQAEGAKLPTGFRRTNPDDPLSDLEPIPGGPGTQLSPEVAAKAGLIETGLAGLADATKLFTKDFGATTRLGTITGFGETGRAMRTITLAVEAALRAVSGAGVPETEVTRFRQIFSPIANDSVKTAKSKLNRLSKTLTNIQKFIFRGRGGVPSEGVSGETKTGIKFKVK